MKTAPISIADAKVYFEKHSAFRGDFTAAIAASDDKQVHGVIAFSFDGKEFVKRQISTDGNAQVGTLLYGAAVRVGMALGYEAFKFGE